MKNGFAGSFRKVIQLQFLFVATMLLLAFCVKPRPWDPLIAAATVVAGIICLYYSAVTRRCIDTIVQAEARAGRKVDAATMLMLENVHFSVLRSVASDASTAIAKMQRQAEALNNEAAAFPALAADADFQRCVRTGRFTKAHHLIEIERRRTEYDQKCAARAARRAEARSHEVDTLVSRGVALGADKAALLVAADRGHQELFKAVNELEQYANLLERARRCRSYDLVVQEHRELGMTKALTKLVMIETLVEKAKKYKVDLAVLNHLGKSDLAAAAQCVDEARKAFEFNDVMRLLEERVGRVRPEHQHALRTDLSSLTAHDFGSRSFAARLHAFERKLEECEIIKRTARH